MVYNSSILIYPNFHCVFLSVLRLGFPCRKIFQFGKAVARMKAASFFFIFFEKKDIAYSRNKLLKKES